MFKLRSAAVGLRSLGSGNPTFPLMPILSNGCPLTSTADVQYPLEVDYDYAAVSPSLFDRVPLPGLDRWSPLLPPLADGISLGEGGTPLLPAPPLGAALPEGVAVFIKDESRNPTLSHKDRLNLCTVSAARASGAPGVVAASTGNHGISAAAYAARAGLAAIVITSDGTSEASLAMLEAYGAMVVSVPAAERWPLMRAAAGAGFHPVSNLTDSHTGHPWGPEGYKTIAYELFLQLDRRVPSAVLVPTGYGEQLYGIHKGFCELRRLGLSDRLPRLFSAEPAVMAPLHHAVAAQMPVAHVPAQPTRQRSIACRVGSFRGVVALRDSGGRALTVTDEEVAVAQRRLAAAGLWQEFSGAAAAAALDQLTADEAGDCVVVVATSNGIKDAAAPAALVEIEPTLEALGRTLRDRYGYRL